MIFLEENFKWHLEVFASELFIQKYFNRYGAKKKKNCTTTLHNHFQLINNFLNISLSWVDAISNRTMKNHSREQSLITNTTKQQRDLTKN